jgi:hypothetical protein
MRVIVTPVKAKKALLSAVPFLFQIADHTTDGYRRVSDVSYPYFLSAGGHHIELREGPWNGSGFDGNLKLIHLPVLKTYGGTGITGALKHCYGILSMADGYTDIRHYSQAGVQCGKMISLLGRYACRPQSLGRRQRWRRRLFYRRNREVAVSSVRQIIPTKALSEKMRRESGFGICRNHPKEKFCGFSPIRPK